MSCPVKVRAKRDPGEIPAAVPCFAVRVAGARPCFSTYSTDCAVISTSKLSVPMPSPSICWEEEEAATWMPGTLKRGRPAISKSDGSSFGFSTLTPARGTSTRSKLAHFPLIWEGSGRAASSWNSIGVPIPT